ncbi:tetratricopeptide repeat protein [Candidatus Poribacteria bacterium]|nr:tetratricopeptide repeat protein [Candidatus Poribacteria bacterium]
MRNEESIYGKIFFVLICILFIFTNNIFAQAFKRFKEGDKVIPFALKTLDDVKIDIKQFENNNVVGVVFWKLEGARSVPSLKYMQKIADIYSKDFNFITISIYCPKNEAGISSSELEEVKKIINENKISIPVLLDEGLKVFSTYGVISFPSTMILDKEGAAKYVMAGFPKFGAEQDINKNVKKILGIPEEIVAKKKYEPQLAAGRNYKLALAVLDRGNTDKAINYLKTAVEMDPSYPDPYILLGKLYIQAQKKDIALENYRKGLELDPDNIEVLLNYGFLCLEAGMGEDALLIFKTVLEKSPENSSSAHYGIGSIYLNNKMYDSARTEAEQAGALYAVKKLVSYEKFYYARNTSNLAEIYINLQEKNKAIDAYKNAGKKYEEILVELVKKQGLEAE